SPPRTVAEARASHGFSPASTSDSTSHARWLARRDPPPKSVPAAIRTPARWAKRTLSTARSRRRAMRSFPSSLTNRGIVVVEEKEAHERKIASVLTRNIFWRAIAATASESSSKPCSSESTPPSMPTRAPARNPECAVTKAPRPWAISTTARVEEEVAVVLRDLKQEGGSVEPAVDPMRPAGEGHVAVRVDHARDDRRSAGIDDAGVGVEDSLVRRRTNREDPVAGNEDADALLERRSRRVGEGRIPIKDESGNRHPAGDGSSRISPGGFQSAFLPRRTTTMIDPFSPTVSPR